MTFVDKTYVMKTTRKYRGVVDGKKCKLKCRLSQTSLGKFEVFCRLRIDGDGRYGSFAADANPEFVKLLLCGLPEEIVRYLLADFKPKLDGGAR